MLFNMDFHAYVSHAAYSAGRGLITYFVVYKIAQALKYRFRKGWIIVVASGDVVRRGRRTASG